MKKGYFSYLTALFILANFTSTSQIITTISGNGATTSSGDGGPATAAGANPFSAATDGSGNIYFGDLSSVRMINVSGVVTTIAGSTSGFSGDGGPATGAKLKTIYGIASDAAGNLFIADMSNHRIRKVNTGGIITTVAGSGVSVSSGDGSPATAAGFINPVDVAVDGTGKLYIADELGYCIRMVNTSGIISTVAGTGVSGFSGDGGAATAAVLGQPEGIATDGAGNLYIVDGGSRVRKISTSGIITTVAGNGTLVSVGDGGPATAAGISAVDIAVNAAGDLFISGDNRIRKVNTSGIISTIVNKAGTAGFSGDGAAANTAQLDGPSFIAINGTGDLFIPDQNNYRLRKVTNTPIVITGTTVVCAAATITLSCATPGGTWTSSNTAIAAVGTGTGIVTGVAGGTAIISYIGGLSTGTVTVTVDPLPAVASITGPDSVCVGHMITLVDATTGGAWNSTDPSITLSGTGVATGITTGTAAITYKVANTCGTANAYFTIRVLTSGACSSLGLPVSSIDNSISISPNPGNGDFTISTQTASNEVVTISITNMYGAEVYNNKILPQNGTAIKHINLGLQIAKGIYILKIATAAGNKMTRVIID